VSSVVEDILNKLKQCDDFHNRCDCLLEHSEITYLLEYIKEQEKENGILKYRLNDIIFDDTNADVELGARYLRKIGYIGFDEERKVYINKHNEEPFWQEDEREKNYYIQDEELDEYTKQLEYKLQQKENIIKTFVKDLDKTIEFCTNEADGTTNDKICRITIQYLKHLKGILDKENK